MNADDYPLETLELVYKEVDNALNRQFQSLDGLNTKASVIIGFIGMTLGISLNLYPHSNAYPFVSCMTLFLISFFFALYASYRVKGYMRDPGPRKLTENYLSEDCAKVKKQLIDNFIKSFEYNKTKIEKTVKYINYSITLLFMGLIVLTLSILVG